jgi:methyl-accepting chemotaxis protein
MSSTYGSGDTTSNEPNNEPKFGDSSDSLNEMRDAAVDATQTAKEQVAAAAQPIADKARDVAEEQKQSGADRIDEVARAVHTAADEIGKQVPQVANYIHSGAEQLERTSRVLRENSVDELLQMTNRFAHDRPLAFIGGSVAAGFMLARFLKSSGSPAAQPGPRT